MRLSLALLLAAAALAACAGPAPPALTRADLEARVAERPDDAAAHRDLGALLAREQQFGPAVGALARAAELDPADGQALYLLGLTHEALDAPAEAEQAYARYLAVPRTSAYRDSLRGRLDAIVRTRLRAEFGEALAADSVASVGGTDAVGVLPFAYRGANADYAALGRGLAEVLSVDLAAVEGLTVVERVRLQALLAEFELARQGRLDPATAPRAGRLLRAERLVGGEYDIQGEDVRIDAAVWQGADVPDLETNEGGLADLFRVQKRVTMTVLTALGVTVSQADLRRLSDVPTDNLRAFLLFSRGLLEEDDGDFLRAAQLYGEALALDPRFGLAAQRRADAGLSASSARPAAPVLLAIALQAAPASVSDAVSLRSAQLGATLRGGFVPGTDAREAVIDGSSVGILGPLPDPPPPPSSQGGE
jgi:tetratricopeptide (TPR) repeat protein